MDYGVARRAIIGEQKHRWVNNNRLAGDVNWNHFILITIVHLGIGVIEEKLAKNGTVRSSGRYRFWPAFLR